MHVGHFEHLAYILELFALCIIGMPCSLKKTLTENEKVQRRDLHYKSNMSLLGSRISRFPDPEFHSEI